MERLPATFVLAASTIFFCADASAFAWNYDYALSLTAGQDDNFRLSPDNEIDTTSSNIFVSASLAGLEEISEVRFGLSAFSENYSESSIDDQTGYGLSFDAARSTERLKSFIGVSIDTESTTETELLDSGVNEDGSRDSILVAPGLRYRLSLRDSMSVGLRSRDVSYDTVSLVEYRNNTLLLDWDRSLDETSSISAGFSTSRYDPDGGAETDTDSVTVGYEFKTSEVMAYRLTVGYSEIDRPTDTESNNDYEINVNYRRDERNRFSLSLSNSYRASGAGVVREEDRLRVSWGHGLSERAQVTLSVDGVDTENRDFFAVNFGANYQILRELNLATRLRYRERDENSMTADSTSIFFTVVYSPL